MSMSRQSLGLLVVLLMSSTFTHAQEVEGELIVYSDLSM